MVYYEKLTLDKIPKAALEGYKLDIRYIAKDKAEPQIYPVGELLMRLSATAYGFSGASVNIAGNINFGLATTEQGSIGIKGKALTLADYNENEVTQKRVVDTESLPKPYRNVDKVAADSGVTVDIFAGVEAGGIVSCEVLWKLPKVKYDGVVLSSEPLNLGKVKGQVAVSAGYGISGVCRIAFHMGTLYLIAKAKLVCGPGASGEVAIELNYSNVDRFIQCLLGVLNESGFVKIDALGSIGLDGRSDDFELLNAYLTMSVVFGLTLGEALLIPMNFIDEVKKNGLQADYVELLAKNITDNDGNKANQIWVKNLPPETLANLLDCLLNKGTLINSFYRDEKDIEKLMKQGESIKMILNWIAGSNVSNVDDINKRQFELTMMNLVGNLESMHNPIARWKSFGKGVDFILDYFRFIRNIVKNPLVLMQDMMN